MHDIRYLEEEWKRYRKKQSRFWRYFLRFTVIIGLAVGVIYSIQQPDIRKEIEKMIASFQNETFPQASKIEHTIVINPQLTRLETPAKEEKYVAPKVMKKPTEILVDIPILDGSSESIRGNVSETQHVRQGLQIIKTASPEAYRDVEARFRQSHNADDGLFLAKSYYKMGDFQKSEYWALETNKINPDLEESLLLFVKSKARQGNINEAKNILDRYIRQTDSTQAKTLLNRLENGKF